MRGEKMERTRLLIIDDNKSLVEMIKEYFSDNADINVTLTAYDGAEGMLLADKKKKEAYQCLLQFSYIKFECILQMKASLLLSLLLFSFFNL